MHDPWDQASPGDRLPPDVRKIVDEFLNHPDRKKDVRVALAAVQGFLKRTKEVGVVAALAEVDDRDTRVAIAKALHEMKQAVGRPPVPG